MNMNMNNTSMKAKDRIENINVTLDDIYNQKSFKLNLKKKIIDSSFPIKDCPKCDGKGKFIQMNTIGPGMISQSIRTCSACNGLGKNVKMITVNRCIEITLKNNYKNGSKIIINGEGHEVYGVSKQAILLLY